jgi:hypothetical protein
MTAATPGQAPRDRQAEQDHAEFTGWAEAQGIDPLGMDYAEHGADGLRDAFTAGMQAQRGLAAAQQPAPELAAVMAETRDLRALAAEILGSFSPTGGGMSSRVGQVQIAKWARRAGLESARMRELLKTSGG